MLQGTPDHAQVDSIVEEGRALIQGGDAKGAVSCFVRAAEAAPQNAKVWNDLGVALFITDQIQPAIEAFETSIRFDSKFPDAYINLATAASKSGDVQLTQRTLNQALDCLPDHAEIQAVYRDLGGAPAAPSIATQVEAPTPTQDPVQDHVLRGRQCVADGNIDEACQAFLKALELDPTCAPAWNDLGVALYSNGEPAAAFEAFQTCITHDSSFADGVMNMVAAAERVGKTSEAIIALQSLLAVNPANSEARTALSKLEKNSDQGEAARQTAALQLMHEGRESLGEENYADAGRKFLEATEIAPGFAPPWNDLGVALYLESHNDLAFQAFETSLQLAPDFVDAAINLTKCAKRLGRVEEVSQRVDLVVKKNPNDADLAKAVAEMRAGETVMPTQDVATPAPLVVDPIAPVFTASADTLTPIDTNVGSQQSMQEAANALENILLKGREQVMAGDYTAACNSFLDAIAVDLTCAIAWNDLGVAMYQSLAFESSIEAFETAMMHDPELADAPINMANSLRKLGQNDAALNVLQTAMIRCPQDDDIRRTFDMFSAAPPAQNPMAGWLSTVKGQSFVAIDIDTARANANVAAAKSSGATQASVQAPTAIRDGLINTRSVEKSGVVYCGEVLERVPNPAQTLNHLRQIATDTVVVTTRCVPSSIVAPAGTIEFTGNSACFVPAAGSEVKAILESFEAKEGRDVEFINGTAVEGSWLLGFNDEPRAVWWAWTEQFVQEMIETAGFSVVQMKEASDKGVTTFVCRVV